MDKNQLQTYLVDVLGCKVNQYDAQQIEQLLERYGLEKAEIADNADVIVVHTCGVTSTAAQKSRQTIRRMQRDNPLAQVIVSGCAAKDELTGVDQDPVFRVPAGADWLERMAEQLDLMAMPNTTSSEGITTDTFSISRFGDHTRAFLKVQDGCDIGCSFCIIPQLRKEPRDKLAEVAVQEAIALTNSGYREIVVTGVSVGLYGRNSGTSLAELLKQLSEIENIGRIRLSSLHPGELTDELLEVWADAPNIMPHLHLSLQSGSDAVLHAMRRGYTASEYFDAVRRARAVLDNPAFTTDVIVGFPGESDTYFEESYDFCKQVGFSRLHVFAYSPRPKTMAAKMNQQVPGNVAAERSEQLRTLGTEMALEYHRQFLDKEVGVLVERTNEGIAQGYIEQYAPATFPSDSDYQGKVVPMKVTDATSECISGTINL